MRHTCTCFIRQFLALLTFLAFGNTSFSGIDHCFDKPCKNNGSCVNSKDGYQCTCSAEFTGADCEGKLCIFALLNIMKHVKS